MHQQKHLFFANFHSITKSGHMELTFYFNLTFYLYYKSSQVEEMSMEARWKPDGATWKRGCAKIAFQNIAVQ